MPMIYLKHPQHGIKQTPVEAEAKDDEQHGWVRYDPAAPEIPALLINELKRGPGRPRRES